jgi:RND family efflux transporter MFP subunit
MPRSDGDPHAEESGTAERGRPTLSRRGAAALLILALVIGGGVYLGIRGRLAAEAALTRTTEAAAIPFVATIHPEGSPPNQEIVLPGNIQAYTDTPIYARTSGYLRRWYFDIGAHVKAGDLLAEIEAPEIDEQLRQARADLATAEANLKLADITMKRDEDLLKTRAIATQDRDNAVGADNADAAIVASKQADAMRLERLQSYEKVYAPFAGIVTARNTDTGALIDAGASGAARELFHLSAIDKVRIYTAVPEAYVRVVHTGAAAAVTLDEFPNTTFRGTVVRSTGTIDSVSRALTVEVDVDNEDGRLLPGAYALVHLSLAGNPQSASVTVPANAVIFRKDGLRVAVVRDGKATLVPIAIGRDYGTKVEIVSGLASSDEVILDPSDSLTNGTAVRTQPAPAAQ